MAFRVFENSDQGAAFVVTLLTLPICFLVTSIRLAVIVRSGRKIAVEDWFAFLSFFPYLGWAVYALVLVVDVENGTKAIFDIPEFDPKVWKDTIITGYVLQIFFGVQQTLAKMSLLIFYHRVFSVNKTFVRLSYLVGFVQLSYCIAWVFTSIFMCNPPRKTWEPLIEGSCLDLSVVLAATETINSAVDFVMVGMAAFIVDRLKVSTANKWKLGALFGFGGLTGILGFVRIGMAYGTVGDSDHVLVYMILQMASSIICCCLPIYRAAFTDLPGLRWLRATFRSGRSSKGSSAPSARVIRPSFKTIGQKSTNGVKGRRDEDWMQLDESCSTRTLTSAWAERESMAKTGAGAPLQTLEVLQTVESA
ncbi:hypothetical protein F4780DRAFT_767396 [Xylariomycetidae sp. FL0641]|nr:hypothetical protein F4780DRAFT_767396 [Xylariomycetidae sp. FL0641]